MESSIKVHAVRLRPGQEILASILQVAKENDIKAGFIMTCVGSVTKATLRYAHNNSARTNKIETLNNHYEIVSLVGTLTKNGLHHLHIALSDADGHVIGGHVMGDLLVFTTAEIVIGHCTDLTFTRPDDPETGYDELMIEKKP